MYMPELADKMCSNVRLYTSSTQECSHYLCGSLGLTTPRGRYRIFQKGGLRPAIRNAGGGGGGWGVGGGGVSASGPIRKGGGGGGGGCLAE